MGVGLPPADLLGTLFLALTTSRRMGARAYFTALLLVVAAWTVYRPALNQVFVKDQIWYFAELEGKPSLAEGLRHYDYAATRHYWKGDDALFRPLLFAWLAVANRLFTFHHVCWNTANLVLHMLVGWFLFRLLDALRPSVFAAGGALLFVVLTPPLALVVWHHLGGYLLASVFLLIALRAFVQLTLQSDRRGDRAATAIQAAAFTAAGLFYEAMVGMALVAGVIVLCVQWQRGARPTLRRVLALFAPVLVFALFYVFHMLRVERLSYVEGVAGVFDPSNLLRAAPASLRALWHWTQTSALPATLEFRIRPFDRIGMSQQLLWRSPLHIVNVALLLSALICLARSISLAHLRRSLPILLLLACSAMVYAAVICIGRLEDEVSAIPYYLYIFCVLLVVFFYALVDFDRLHGKTVLAAGVITLALFILHSSRTLKVTREIRAANQDASRYLDRLARFVDLHKHEPDFTFSVLAHPDLDPWIDLWEGYSDNLTAGISWRRLTEILFEPYYAEDRPKYVFERDEHMAAGR